MALGLAAAAAFHQAPAAGADSDAEAKQVYRQGVEAFEDGRFDDAARLFRRANELKPSWRLLYNLGQSEAAARRFGLAIDAFEKYLVGGGDDVPGERREEVLAEIQRLRVLVGAVEVRAPEGTELLIDGISYGKVPFSGPVRVAAGEHRAVLRLGDEVLLERKVGIAGGMTTSLAVDETVAGPVDDGEPPQREDPEPGPDPGGGRVWTWVALGLGVAAVAGGGVTGGLSMKREGDLMERCPNKACAESERGEADTIRRMNLTADILYGVGAVAIVTGIVLFFVEPGARTESQVTVLPASGDHPGFSLTGRF